MHLKLFKRETLEERMKKKNQQQKTNKQPPTHVSAQKSFLCFLFRDLMNTPVIQAARPHYQRVKEPGQLQEFSNHVLQ